jgi:hypothetical protein
VAFEDDGSNARQGQFAGEHEAVGAGSDDEDIDHDRDPFEVCVIATADAARGRSAAGCDAAGDVGEVVP